MIKTLQNTLKQDKEQFTVPKSVQDAIPIRRIWPDGVFQFGSKFSKCIRFSDINYAIASKEDKTAMFLNYSELLNALDTGSTTKITINNKRLNRQNFEETILLPPRGDFLDGYRAEYNAMLTDKVTDSSNSVVQERYITLSAHKKNIEEARTFFDRTVNDVTSRLNHMDSHCEELDAVERLRILHDFYRVGEETQFQLDLTDCMKRGRSFKDAVCPDSMEFKKDHFVMGGKYGRVLFLKEYASYIKDSMISELCELNRNLMLSIDIIPIPTDEAVREMQNKLLGIETNVSNWQRKQNAANNFSAVIPYDMELQRKETKEFLDDLTTRDQRMMFVVVTLAHTADTLEQLNTDTEALLSVGRKHLCQMSTLSFQQMDALNTALPYGVRKINALRTLTTEALAVLTPFKSREIMEPGGFYLGNNQTTGNPILLDRALLQNPNLFLLGIPGSGKSMILKQIVIAMALGTQDDILLCDPEGEASAIVRALGGEVIRISVGSDTHINAMDLTEGYSEGNKPWLEKSEFVLSLLEQLDKRGFGLQEKSLIDRCLDLAYEDYLAGAPMPTLCELRQKLLEQPEKEAEGLALAFERFTNGSLNVFSQPTNVKVKSRIISYDISGLGAQLRTIGTLVVSDAMSNRVADNWRNGKRTHILIDEFHVMLENPHGAEFFNSAWRRYRKRNGFPVAATQNVEALLATVQGSTMISNSECVVMLNQAPRDAEKLTELFHISESQQNYIINAPAGSGLLRYGGALVPFMNRFKTDTELYKLITTKPGE